MDCLVCLFHGRIVKENGELENMQEVVEVFEVDQSFQDIVHLARSNFSCEGVDEIILRGRVDCGKARACYMLMNLASGLIGISIKKMAIKHCVFGGCC